MPINDPEKSENMRKSIRVYSGSSNRPLAQKIAEYLGVELSGLTLKQFANGEIYARYDETVRGADVFLIQSVAGGNVNDMLMELLIATDAAKRASARSITAVITHYGYARQDRKAGPREPITARLVANLLERAGVNRIITLALHQGQIQGFFDIPVNHLSALPLFGQYYNDMHFDTDNLVVVSPDVGRAKAAKKLSDMLGCDLAIAHKGRPRHNAAEVMGIIGDIKGKTWASSGVGKVAWGAATKATELGAKVVTISGPDGYIYDPNGISGEKIDYMLELRSSGNDIVAPYADEFPGSTFVAGKRPWEVKADIALPCATQNELNGEDAQHLIDNKVTCVGEISNMGCTPEAIDLFIENKIMYAPGKAVNAGGVATSGLEMSQNAMHLSWSAAEVDEKLHAIMHGIHAQCVKYGTEPDGYINYVKGANIAGFMKVAHAMMGQGII